MLDVKVKILSPNAVVPKYAHATDTGFDLYTSEDLVLDPKCTGIAKTGLAFELPEGWGIMLRNRSGITVKGCPAITLNSSKNVPVTVFIGTLDEDYRGEIGIMHLRRNIQLTQIRRMRGGFSKKTIYKGIWAEYKRTSRDSVVIWG